MKRLAKSFGRWIGLAATALALLMAGNLAVYAARDSGEADAAAPEAVARITPALRGPYD